MSELEAWDRRMTSEEVFRLSPKVAALRTMTSFRRKVALLQRALEEPALLLSLDPKDFKNRTRLRRWESDEHRLWKWSDTLVDKPSDGEVSSTGDGLPASKSSPARPREADTLIDQWIAARDAITKMLNGGRIAELEAIISSKDAIIASLERQVCEQMNEISMLHTRLAGRR